MPAALQRLRFAIRKYWAGPDGRAMTWLAREIRTRAAYLLAFLVYQTPPLRIHRVLRVLFQSNERSKAVKSRFRDTPSVSDVPSADEDRLLFEVRVQVLF